MPAETGTFDATVRPLIVLAQKGGHHETLRAATVGDREEMMDPSSFHGTERV